MLAFYLITLAYSVTQVSDVNISPDPMLVGQRAKIECRVSEPHKVVKVSLVIFNGLMKMDMEHQGDGLYQLRQDLPIDAPTGTFPASIVVELEDGTRIEQRFSFTITEPGVLSFGTLKPTFTLDESADIPIPRQNGVIFPSLERQSERPTIELSGNWYSKRFPEADHDLSLTERTTETLELLSEEMPCLFESPDFRPAKSGWKLKRVPAPDNSPPDRYQGCVWYARNFHVPGDWEGHSLRLTFLAANYIADVWLNDQWIGYHEGGYTPFVFDVTDGIHTGEVNMLYVRVDNIPWLPRLGGDNSQWHNNRDIIPYATADWWNYGGILRDVYLECLPAMHIARLDAQGSIQNSVPVLKGTAMIIHPPESLHLSLFTGKKDTLLKMHVDRCAGGEILAEMDLEVKSIGDDLGLATFRFPVEKANPWTSENPQLYYLRAEIPDGDAFTTQVGFRNISTERDKLLWNDQPTYMKGASRHEDYPVIGRGLTYADMSLVKRDLELMKEMKSNFIRLSHYPNHPMTALLTDRVGLVVWEEIPVYWFSSTGFKNQKERGIARQMWLEMIYTDYNRPSIGFWSTCNECSAQDERREYIRDLYELSKRVDGSRLVVQSAAGASVDLTHKETDVIGMTLYYGVFYGDDPYADTLALLDQTHQVMPGKPIICSEFGYWAMPNWSSSDKQLRIAEETFRALISRDFIWGATWWIGFDYQTFHTQTNSMGAVTLDRFTRRPVYDRLRELYDQEIHEK
jgi:beta-glucuronidase